VAHRGDELDQLHAGRRLVTGTYGVDDAGPVGGLLEGGTVTAPIAKGELITYANAAPRPDSPLVALRRKQDEMVAALG